MRKVRSARWHGLGSAGLPWGSVLRVDRVRALAAHRGGDRLQLGQWERANPKLAGAIAKAIAMLGLAGVVVHYLLGRRQEAGDARAVAVSADLLALPAGRAILGVAAVVILALAGGMVDTEVRCTFMGDLDMRRMSPVMRRLIAVIGAIGHLARAVALAIIALARRACGPLRRRTAGGWS
jgi:hypothetical protein